MATMKPIEAARKNLDRHNAARMTLISRVTEYAPDVSPEHIEDVLDALWLLQKIDYK